MKRRFSFLVVVLLFEACAPLPDWGDRVPTIAPAAEASRPVITMGPDGLTLTPISVPGALIGRAYRYDMPHCGLFSPIDIDGSFWDPINVGGDLTRFDGQAGTFILVDRDHATFTTSEERHTVTLVRHEGPKQYPFCG